MDNGDHITKMNTKRDIHKLTNIEKEYIERVNNLNKERVEKWTKLRYKNRFIAGFLGASVVSIYLYSMYAIQQENFLDDFNEPEKVADL